MATHILGIRHHGVGSAKQVKKRLQELQPDIILVEGPPEITEALQYIGHKELQPPVAIMVYDEKQPSISTFYPFAEFSPEFVAANYAIDNQIPLKAMDLPAATSFNINERYKESEENNEEFQEVENQSEALDTASIHKDPLSYFSDIAGFDSGEAWWEFQFEQNVNSAKEHFEAVLLTMKTLREANITSSLDEENVYREAYMRHLIQEVENQMYQNIVVVCGAWHAPALEDIDQHQKEDAITLKKLPKPRNKIAVSWIPWTNQRLSMSSGYGAGLTSPGWYEQQWITEEQIEINWLTKIATAFRDKDVDISTAHVLESYKLAYSLAALRNKAQITLQELNESVNTVMCMGNSILFELIREEIIVGERIGEIPEELPKVPLQLDFEQTAKSLRLKFTAMSKRYDLDLRKDIDLKRSIFFHRLKLLAIPWAQRAYSRSKGTFKESWELVWQPEMQIGIVDKAFYGNTIESACLGVVKKQMKETKQIAALINLLEKCIPSELFSAVDQLLQRINDESAISADTLDLMNAVPGLVNIVKYGNVRQSDTRQMEHIAKRLLVKICISLPNACYGLDEDNSINVFEKISAVHQSVKILDDEDIETQWFDTIKQILDTQGVHAIIVGCCVRLLLDNNQIEASKSSQVVSYYLSPNQNGAEVAFWIEGFLRGSGLILIYDNRIWNLLYEWVDSLNKDQFIELLPVLRRAFAKFAYGERRQIGVKAKQGITNEGISKEGKFNFNEELAASILPTISKFLRG